jgi:hypothetical protein
MTLRFISRKITSVAGVNLWKGQLVDFHSNHTFHVITKFGETFPYSCRFSSSKEEIRDRIKDKSLLFVKVIIE